jgi:serine/threonine protein kinase
MSAEQPSNDPTVIVGARDSIFQHSRNALPVGTRLGEFEIIGLVGEGGFGIVYLARDESLDRTIALKEYMPAELAQREGTTLVAIKTPRHADTFAAGLRSFINEARLLAQFDHPALVKVYRFWEANGTAYMVMPFYEGVTLKRTVQQQDTAPDEAWLRRFLSPLLEALEIIHSRHCFHRDIAPDNILMLESGNPLLLDFGAARRVIGDMTQALTVILKPGYAPIEQYAEAPNMRQGAWTDLYALASVVYFIVTGKAPVQAVARVMSDPLIPLAQAAAGRYSERLLKGIDAALSLKPEDRPQTVAEFRAALGLNEWHGPASDRRRRDDSKQSASAIKQDTSVIRRFVLFERRSGYRRTAALVVLALAGISAALFFIKPALLDAPSTARLGEELSSFPCSRLAVKREDERAIISGYVPTEAAFRRIAAAIAAKDSSIAVDTQAVRVIPPPLCDALSALPTPNAPASESLRIGIRTGSSTVTEGTKLVAELVGPDFPAYVYADLYDPQGNVVHLIPNAKEKKNRLEAGQRLILGDNPLFGMQWEIVPPLGKHLLVVMASSSALFPNRTKDVEESTTYVNSITDAVRNQGRSNQFTSQYALVDFVPKQ